MSNPISVVINFALFASLLDAQDVRKLHLVNGAPLRHRYARANRTTALHVNMLQVSDVCSCSAGFQLLQAARLARLTSGSLPSWQCAAVLQQQHVVHC